MKKKTQQQKTKQKGKSTTAQCTLEGWTALWHTHRSEAVECPAIQFVTGWPRGMRSDWPDLLDQTADLEILSAVRLLDTGTWRDSPILLDLVAHCRVRPILGNIKQFLTMQETTERG